MMHSSGRVLRKRFLTKEEKDAWRKGEEKRKREAKVKAIRESMVQKAKAKKERELKKRRAKACMEVKLQGCEPEFRYIVEQWAKDKTVAHVNKFFRLLDEFKCPMEPCYNPNKLDKFFDRSQILLRKNKCGIKELNHGLHIYEFSESDVMYKMDEQKFRRATELDCMLYHMYTVMY